MASITNMTIFALKNIVPIDDPSLFCDLLYENACDDLLWTIEMLKVSLKSDNQEPFSKIPSKS